MSRKLEGKIALVTGSGRGIGRSIALKLASEGARLVVNDVDEAAAEAVADEIRSLGSEAIVCAGSVTQPEFGGRFIGSAMDRWGDLHIIVNNAGYTWDNVIQKMADEQWDAMIDVHLTAPFRILRAAAEPIRALAKREKEAGVRVMRKIVNISSVSGTMGSAGQINYAAGKAGIVGVTKTLAKEWGRYNVTTNCVAFGYIQTRLTQALDSGEATIDVDGRRIKVGVQRSALQAATAAIPLQRGGTPEEAAGAVYLFCIPESDYVSGQTLICGGGEGSLA